MEGPAKGGMIGELQKQPVALAETDWDARQKTHRSNSSRTSKRLPSPTRRNSANRWAFMTSRLDFRKTLIESGLTKTLAGTKRQVSRQGRGARGGIGLAETGRERRLQDRSRSGPCWPDLGERELDLARALAELKRSLWSAEDQHQADLEKARAGLAAARGGVGQRRLCRPDEQERTGTGLRESRLGSQPA